jgi:peptidoglycan/xylan/chitin deacetylase (PgdA/CDA1 family)
MRSLWRSVENIPNDVARDHFDLMGRDEISACLKSGLITIGSHSASHQKLTELGERELDREIRSSKGVLEDVTGQEVDLFAYPFGAVDARVAKSVAAAGFRAAFAEGDSPTIALSMAIPRIGVYQSESWYLAAQFSGVRGRPITGRIVAI